MKKVTFPYGKRKVEHDFEGETFLGTLESSLHEYKPTLAGVELIKEAMAHPIGSPKLSELARGKKNVIIIASDHTRPVPSKIIIPPMLEEIRSASPDAEITILIATGCHRESTREELIFKFGEEIVERERIVMHISTDSESMVEIGTLPSGGRLLINRLAKECDLLIAEGFIEPHLFAGFSGGRKSVLPGISSRETVMANHCSEFIAHPRSRTGILDGNPIHNDMLWAARRAGLSYIVNVIINDKKEAIYAVAGDVEAAHISGCEFLSGLCRVAPRYADIAISTNGGYPLDQNVYQAIKGMTAAEATVKDGGVIIMLAETSDGHGGEALYKELSEASSTTDALKEILRRDRNSTNPDQWQTQILLRILERARVIYVSDAEDSMIEKMHLYPAHSLDEALALAKKLLSNDSPSIVAIPDGIAVMVAEG